MIKYSTQMKNLNLMQTNTSGDDKGSKKTKDEEKKVTDNLNLFPLKSQISKGQSSERSSPIPIVSEKSDSDSSEYLNFVIKHNEKQLELDYPESSLQSNSSLAQSDDEEMFPFEF